MGLMRCAHQREFAYDNGDDHGGNGSVGCGVGGGVGDDDAAGSPRHNRQAAHDAQAIEALSTSRSYQTQKQAIIVSIITKIKKIPLAAIMPPARGRAI